MARKASDLFTLLQSRGGGRGASGRSGLGIFGSMVGWLSSLGGPKRRRYDGGRKTVQFSGIALAGIVFASVGAGYLLGDAFPMGGKNAALRVPTRQEQQGVPPQVLGIPGSLEKFRLPAEKECDALSKTFYVVANYGESGRAQAADLALQLRSQGVDSARPFLVWNPNRWITVAYYDGAEQAEAVRQKLLRVPDLPAHANFAADRKRLDKDWPPALQVP